jgi:protein SCO1/2
MPSHRTLLLVGIAAVALAIGLVAGRASHEAPALRAVTALPAPRALPEVVLASGDAALRPADLAGRWTVVFFGFTHCPDVCPTTLALLASTARALADLPPERRPRVLFVSVDPGRDSPQQALDYARFYDPAFLGATGEPAALERLASALGAPYALGAPDPSGDYPVDHSGAVFILDGAARFAAVMTPPLDAAALAADLRVLTGG